ncbi:MAG: tubulin/FtsZ family protein [Chloroflexota bacterium]
MKLAVIGLGQCGGNIANEFARLNLRAHVVRGVDIVTSALAVNTDAAELSNLTHINPDFQHRILIGSRETGGHGVGKINELGAEVARQNTDRVIMALKNSPQFLETDAFLLTAGAAGGTGSGSIAVMTQYIKELYANKPIYNLIVLPFKQEETAEERGIYNVATCLKSSYLVADAIFLVDNQRFISKGIPTRNDMSRINAMIVEPFYNLLCAGEEKKFKYIGSKLLDAGDIIQTLEGWTTIGYGQSKTPLVKSFARDPNDFRNKIVETQKGLQVMLDALSSLSLKCEPVESKRALYLVSAPDKEINMELVNNLGTHLRKIAPAAEVRSGDYPREKGLLNITVVMSQISHIEKIMGYFAKAINLVSALTRQRQMTSDGNLDFNLIPSLL